MSNLPSGNMSSTTKVRNYAEAFIFLLLSSFSCFLYTVPNILCMIIECSSNCAKYRCFTWLPGVEILCKPTVSPEFWENRLKTARFHKFSHQEIKWDYGISLLFIWNITFVQHKIFLQRHTFTNSIKFESFYKYILSQIR